MKKRVTIFEKNRNGAKNPINNHEEDLLFIIRAIIIEIKNNRRYSVIAILLNITNIGLMDPIIKKRAPSSNLLDIIKREEIIIVRIPRNAGIIRIEKVFTPRVLKERREI